MKTRTQEPACFTSTSTISLIRLILSCGQRHSVLNGGCCYKTKYVMALEIKAIPTLRGKEAERFVKEADKAWQSKEKTDFSKQVKVARAILKKTNML